MVSGKMDSLASVSPSIVLPPSSNPLGACSHRVIFPPSSCPLPRLSSSAGVRYLSCTIRKAKQICRTSMGRGEDIGDEENDKNPSEEEVDRALDLDGSIPGSSEEFVRQVSSRAYDMRRNLQQSFDSSSYDVLDDNPWRDPSKPVYVLTHHENQLCTMKTRRNRSEVEQELGLLFSHGKKRKSDVEKQTKKSRSGMKFQMLVEDIRDGILVFEDENEAARYCDLLQGGGQVCQGVAELEASSVFDLCRKMRALAVLFRKGRTPPLPQSLELNLRARKRSLEDQED